MKFKKLGKSQNWVKTYTSVQSPLQTIAAKNNAKENVKIFWSCPVLIDFFPLSHKIFRELYHKERSFATDYFSFFKI